MLEHFEGLLVFLALYRKEACLHETPPELTTPRLAAPVNIVNVVQSPPKVPKY